MAQASPSELFLPQAFPFPIKIVALEAKPADSVKRGTRLLTYSFAYIPKTPGVNPETRFGTWDAAIEGTLDSWKLKPGDVISKNKARDKPAVIIIEPCKHGIQLGGLCVLCGKDMTNVDYTGFSDASRASIQMTHSAFGPTVSLEEAQRIERETAEHLLKSRKLSLIVDLDQTIVHATVDPTVGEWIAEGEAWEARQAKKSSTTPRDSEDSDDSDDDSDEECNPNWEALKDVKKFRLGPESFSTPHMRGPQRPKGKHKMVENEGCMYYIKPSFHLRRPGWREFLRDTATKYDMHVYTMGTRAYAEEVCAAIDPDGSVFKGRILSRDESGSLTQKSLQRLFPCDTSMVVIIDDRADVWEWSPNLIKVIPYDFFVGIGDINSSFLAKITPLTPSTTATTPQLPQTPSGHVVPDSSEPPSPEDIETAELEQKILLSTNNAALDEQFESRPLAKKQEELEGGAVQHVANNSTPEPPSENQPSSSNEKDVENETAAPVYQLEKPKQALLKNDDTELDRIGKFLDEVHRRFFESYDQRSPESYRRKQGTANKRLYDVTTIIPLIRSEVLAGVHIVFSGVIPLDTPQETTELWGLAHMFGAKCHADLTPEVTHVVTAKRGTKKVETARKRGGIKIVRPEWLNDSVALWGRQDEEPYLFYDSSATTVSASPLISDHQISSDPEPDADDWDLDPVELKARVAQEESEAGSRGGAVGALHLEEIDWNDINDEVEAAMMESDDESIDERSERSTGMRSEDEFTDEGSLGGTSATNTPRMRRKRLRSVTPSEIQSQNGDDSLRSPLAKRKKLAADRYSRLKQGITAEELESTEVGEHEAESKRSTLFGGTVNGDSPEGEGEDEGADDFEDDFLARDLQEEWG
ncbi:RNA polymerase II subunit A C-terminal domain phosphatase [Leucoagaricus sp. SymC.cos]|nr:RNA polymerase II subunit A C-terminal domain phosphatase [Leucoagaricus sp. SymC.cos]